MRQKRKEKRIEQREERNIDRLFEKAVKRFGSVSAMFERACQVTFGRSYNPKELKRAIERWMAKHWLASWVRQFLYTGTYKKVPV